MDKQNADSAHGHGSTGAANEAVAASAEATPAVSQMDGILSFDISASGSPFDASVLSTAAAVAASSAGATAARASSGTEELMPGLGLDFNVDSLNLDSLGGLAGLDFDVANLLRQVSGSATTSLSANAIIGSSGSDLGMLGDPIGAPISAPSILSTDPNSTQPGGQIVSAAAADPAASADAQPGASLPGSANPTLHNSPPKARTAPVTAVTTEAAQQTP
ncbi:hypothetical protein GGF43_001980, partial [Coemansia sp. RSA 2618]